MPRLAVKDALPLGYEMVNVGLCAAGGIGATRLLTRGVGGIGVAGGSRISGDGGTARALVAQLDPSSSLGPLRVASIAYVAYHVASRDPLGILILNMFKEMLARGCERL